MVPPYFHSKHNFEKTLEINTNNSLKNQYTVLLLSLRFIIIEFQFSLKFYSNFDYYDFHWNYRGPIPKMIT